MQKRDKYQVVRRKGLLNELPHELSLIILYFLSPKDILTVGRINRIYNDLINNASLWQTKVKLHFPHVSKKWSMDNNPNWPDIYKKAWIDEYKKLPEHKRGLLSWIKEGGKTQTKEELKKFTTLTLANLVNFQDIKERTLLEWVAISANQPLFNHIYLLAKKTDWRLHLAITLNQPIAEINKAMKKTAPIATAYILGSHHTALQLAAYLGRTEIVKFLIDQGAPIDYQMYPGSPTALCLAVKGGHKAVVDLLLEAGANIMKGSIDPYPTHLDNTLLHSAIKLGYIDIAQTLLNKGFNVQGFEIDAKNEEGYTALHLAANAGYLDLVKLLITYHANLDARLTEYPSGATALLLAIMRGHKDVVHLLLKHNASHSLGLQDLCHSWDCKNRYVELLPGSTPLHVAVTLGYEDLISTLLSKRANIDSTCENGETALHLAAQAGYTDIVECLISTYRAKVNSLTVSVSSESDEERKSSDEDFQKEVGVTPLFLAVKNGHADTVTCLLDSYADIQVISSGGYHALHFAAEKGYSNIIELLLRASGADVNVETPSGSTALLLATKGKHEDTVKYLLEVGADINASSKGYNALHLAAGCGHAKIVEYLMQSGIDPQLCTPSGKTALLLAIENNYQDVSRYLFSQNVHTDANTTQCCNMLSAAMQRNNLAGIEILIEFMKERPFKKDHLYELRLINQKIIIYQLAHADFSILQGNATHSTLEKILQIAQSHDYETALKWEKIIALCNKSTSGFASLYAQSSWFGKGRDKSIDYLYHALLAFDCNHTDRIVNLHDLLDVTFKDGDLSEIKACIPIRANKRREPSSSHDFSPKNH
jgi:ankyrin repeat protein